MRKKWTAERHIKSTLRWWVNRKNGGENAFIGNDGSMRLPAIIDSHTVVNLLQWEFRRGRILAYQEALRFIEQEKTYQASLEVLHNQTFQANSKATPVDVRGKYKHVDTSSDEFAGRK